jgi:hypothetical protein
VKRPTPEELERLGIDPDPSSEARRRWLEEHIFIQPGGDPWLIQRSKATAANWRARGEYVDALHDSQFQGERRQRLWPPPQPSPAGDQCRAIAELLERAGIRCLAELEETR